jgi:hypothetical protein
MSLLRGLEMSPKRTLFDKYFALNGAAEHGATTAF